MRSLDAKRPPSSWTIGRISGGITGITSSIIHSRRFPDFRNASTTSSRLIIRAFFCPVAVSSSALSWADNSLTSIWESSSFIASAPMPTRNALPYISRYSMYIRSLSTIPLVSGVIPGSSTMFSAKYRTCSSCLGDMSSTSAMREGIVLKYQICETGEASSICPMRSRRTFLVVTSTPHFSQRITSRLW